MALMVLPVMLASCGDSARKTDAAAPVHNVFVTDVIPLSGSFSKTFTGIAEEGRTIDLGFKTAGQIETINVREGEYVRPGQLLATLDSKDYALMVKQLQVQYDQVAGDFKRLEYLHERDNVSDSEFEKARAGLQQLGVQLELNRNKLEYTRLYAPVAGYVTKINFEKSEMVNAGTPVFEIMDDADIEVLVDLPAADFSRRKHFSTFTAVDTDSALIPLTLLSITPKADNNQLYLMRLALPKSHRGNITAGRTLSVTVASAGDTDEAPTYAVPLRSVFNTGGRAAVWVLGPDSTISLRPVTVGHPTDGNAVVTSGLDGTETIVRAGVNALRDGEKVRVIDTESETNIGNLL